MSDLIFKIFMYGQIVIGVLIFITLFFLSAPYGRFSRKGWGPAIPAKLGWMIMEFPAFFVVLCIAVIGMVKIGTINPVLIVFLAIWELHYIQRTFIYPMLMPKKAKSLPVMIIIFSIIFNTWNGYINGYNLFFNSASSYEISWLYDPRFIIGTIIFLIGFIINIHSDYVLRHLRKPGETGYKIPNKGMHKLVASPNYLGEITEWIGWAILTWSVAGLAFAIFTIGNLAPRAYTNLKWYRGEFEDYPKKRKALIPFIS
ncbi:MAG: DUF1295 domain-containing protein [Spirochaetales bacterium]|nr:DUF1295 domain-containing protein [Spirochaetales bacterium]